MAGKIITMAGTQAPRPSAVIESSEKLADKIIGPTEFHIPGFAIGGINFPVVADLGSGGYLQIVVGENPMGPVTPSVTIPKGAGVVILAPEVMAQMRPGLREAERRAYQSLTPNFNGKTH